MQCVAFRLKNQAIGEHPLRYLLLYSWYPLTSLRLVSSFRSVSVVSMPSISAYRPEGSSALCTCQCVRFESLTLKMIVKDVADLDENWQMNVACQYACVQKLEHLGPAVCSQHVIVHFLKDALTNERTNEHTTCRNTPFNCIWMDVQNTFKIQKVDNRNSLGSF